MLAPISAAVFERLSVASPICAATVSPPTVLPLFAVDGLIALLEIRAIHLTTTSSTYESVIYGYLP